MLLFSCFVTWGNTGLVSSRGVVSLRGVVLLRGVVSSRGVVSLRGTGQDDISIQLALSGFLAMLDFH